MTEIERIEQMIREGKLSQSEGQMLLAAFTAAQARDTLLLREFESRRGRHRLMAWVIGIGTLVLSVLFIGLLAGTLKQTGPIPAVMQSRIPQALVGVNLDDVISRYERQSREPDGAKYYELLGPLYEQRYQRLQNPEDRQRASEAYARAERYQRRIQMKGNPVVFLLVLLLVIVGLLGAGTMWLYNGLARSDERSDRQWAQIQAQLQRRLDLVPALVETVKNYMVHEKETLVAVTEARARALASLEAVGAGGVKDPAKLKQLDQDQESLRASLHRLLAVAEKYPDLKASQNFLVLQDQLEGTENRIATERMRYNEVVEGYNAKLRVFPSNVIGSAFGFQPRQYFESKLEAEDAPALKFKS